MFVYIPQTGYVGVGTVTREARPFPEAVVDVGGRERRLSDLDLQGTYVHTIEKDEDITEYVVTVEWSHQVPQKRSRYPACSPTRTAPAPCAAASPPTP